MPTPKWRKAPFEKWEAQVRALEFPRQIRAHVACIVWWDMSLHKSTPEGWLLDLRQEYDEWAKEDRNVLAAALAAVGYPPAIARARAFKDILSGYIPKKRPGYGADADRA
ncbi:MAG: hypothetical protein IKQ55_03780 [Kiritimatiellae bacterium]|nr:hypothetical protein [Kiritimatiellia bacterium]